jgi:hypothetical protein
MGLRLFLSLLVLALTFGGLRPAEAMAHAPTMQAPAMEGHAAMVHQTMASMDDHCAKMGHTMNPKAPCSSNGSNDHCKMMSGGCFSVDLQGLVQPVPMTRITLRWLPALGLDQPLTAQRPEITAPPPRLSL